MHKKNNPFYLLPGIMITAILAGLSFAIHYLPMPPFTLKNGTHPIEAMSVALVLGILFASLRKPAAILNAGIQFSSTQVLSVGIVLLGFSMNLGLLRDIPAAMPFMLVGLSIISLCTCIILAKVFKLDTETALLVGIGNAVCGSSAIIVLARSLNIHHKKVAITVAIANILGLIAIFALPAIAAAVHFNALQTGFWTGSTIQAVAQAVAAGFNFSHMGGIYATTIKLTRVLLLGPFIIALTLIYKKNNPAENVPVGKINLLKQAVPFFLVCFILAVITNSIVVAYFPQVQLAYLHPLSKFSAPCLTVALAAIGLRTNLKSLVVDGKSYAYLASFGFIVILLIAFWLAKFLH